MSDAAKNLAYYRRLPYTMVITGEKGTNGKWFYIAEYQELRGCKVDGSTETEAVNALYSAFDEYIEMLLESGHIVPEPVVQKVLVEPVKVKKENIFTGKIYGREGAEEKNIGSTEALKSLFSKSYEARELMPA